MFDSRTLELARKVIRNLEQLEMSIVTAESCTGGLIGGALTAIPGSSGAVFGGFITYANRAKSAFLNVPDELLATHGAVSEPVARAMAKGALRNSDAQASIAITGIAGPDGGTPDKPVGLVHLACATDNLTVHHREFFPDHGRAFIRQQGVQAALQLILDTLALSQE